jgi:hypothetical protein
MVTQAVADDFLDAYRRAMESSDVDLALSLYHDDAELREDPFEPIVVGSLEIRARWNHHAAARAHVEVDVERSWLSGSTLLVAWHGAHTRRATGERVRRRGFVTFELDGSGLVSRERHWTMERTVGVDGTLGPDADAPSDVHPGGALSATPEQPATRRPVSNGGT